MPLNKETKPKKHGRPVISSTNCHTRKLFKYVDYFIKPLAKKEKSFIGDTMVFLNKITYKTIA